MADMEIRDLAESDWETYRELRLAALKDSPDSFAGTYEDESVQPDDFWRARIRRAHRFVAERDGRTLGVVGLGKFADDTTDREAGEIFDLWVKPDERASRIAVALVVRAAQEAAVTGRKRLFFWVVPDNVPAVAFATSFGFHPTSARRLVTPDGEDEVALVMSLSEDPTSVKNPFIP